MANLADFSMLRWEAETVTVTVHRVVQEILRTRQDEPRKWLTAALRLLDAASPKESYDVRTWPILDPLRPHLACVAHHADEAGIHDLNNLAALLQATNRLAEAEPLMRRALAIVFEFKRSTGHEHSSYTGRLEQYRSLLTEMKLSPAEIERRLSDLLGPITEDGEEK